MGLSLAEAARQAGVSKSSVWRAIQDGRLKAKRSRGRFAIDPDELTRVFPALDPDVRSGATAAKGRYYVPRGVEIAIRLAQAEQQVADLMAALKEARQDRDRWQQLAERLTGRTKRTP
jgi:excisionase family DNA binding protein